MHESAEISEDDFRRRLDALVINELAEGDRRQLILSMESDVSNRRWRACAIAFLEAQFFETALKSSVSSSSQVSISTPSPAKSIAVASPGTPTARGGHFLQLAATALITFGIGVFTARLDWNKDKTAQATPANTKANGIQRSELPQQDLLHAGLPHRDSTSIATVSSKSKDWEIQIPVESLGGLSDPKPLQSKLQIGEYEKKQWARRGYEVSTEWRFLPGKLPDGQTVAVAVEQIKAKHVGLKVD